MSNSQHGASRAFVFSLTLLARASCEGLRPRPPRHLYDSQDKPNNASPMSIFIMLLTIRGTINPTEKPLPASRCLRDPYLNQ